MSQRPDDEDGADPDRDQGRADIAGAGFHVRFEDRRPTILAARCRRPRPPRRAPPLSQRVSAVGRPSIWKRPLGARSNGRGEAEGAWPSGTASAYRRGGRRWLDDLDGLREDVGSILAVAGSEIVPRGAQRRKRLFPHRRSTRSTAATPPRLEMLRSAGRGRHRPAHARRDHGPRLPDHRAPMACSREALGVESVVPSPDGLTVPPPTCSRRPSTSGPASSPLGHVYFTTGAANDLRALADLCHERGALLLVDAYQATGIVLTDVVADRVDAYVSGTLKWLFGIGHRVRMGASGALHEALRPGRPAGSAAPASSRLPSTSLLSRRTAGGTSSGRRRCQARRSRVAASSSSARSGSSASASGRDLGDLVIDLAHAAGLRVVAVRRPERRGDRVDRAEPKPIVDALAGEGIIVDYRLGVVRCSPAFYNAEAEVERLVERLAALVPVEDRAIS